MNSRIKNIFNKTKNGLDNIKGLSSKKIKQHVRDKAYKEVVKETIEEGIDITVITPDDLEALIYEKEKEINEKIKNMGVGAITTFLGLEALSV